MVRSECQSVVYMFLIDAFAIPTQLLVEKLVLGVPKYTRCTENLNFLVVVDLHITPCTQNQPNANGIEVTLCEFKRNVDRNKLAEQQGKCCRLNVALLEDSEPIRISDRVITTTRVIYDCCQDKLIAIEKGMDDIYLVYLIDNAEAPTDQMLLDDVLVQSITTLYQWKAIIFLYLINSGSNNCYSLAL
ncbi:hypothetical protein EDC96DRAFT_541121 [Choanephora cucurbitarum]|nr:hypothetical protein EDC96DRAFT_541121 [Choanephora cucurbitarum]